MTVFDFVSAVSSGRLDSDFSHLYGDSDMELLWQRTRWLSASEQFSKLFPEREEIHIFSVPFCTGIAGNYTAEQRGILLSAALNRDIIAVVNFHNEGVVRICAEGHIVHEIGLSDISPQDDERGTISGAVRGIIAGAVSQGAEITGFDIFVSADISEDLIVSPTPAFEILIVSIIDSCCGRCSDISETEEIIRYAENKYYSSSCRMTDRISCKAGGIISIDLKDSGFPQIQAIDCDISSGGYSLCAVSVCDCSGNEFSECMESAAKAMNCAFLSDADEFEFYEEIPEIRGIYPDSVLMFPAYFFDENRRAVKEISALKRGDLNEFFGLVNESGLHSAYMYDTCSAESGSDKRLLPALMMSRRILDGCGASQICINGSSGIVQAFVPAYMAEKYASEMERIFKSGRCSVFSLRKTGAVEIKI